MHDNILFKSGDDFMDIRDYMAIEGEKPLDNIKPDGGFCGIFRTIGIIGDSLSSGEFEGMSNEGLRSCHDMYEYSWGQYIARAAGLTAYNFSRGGMTAMEYIKSFGAERGFWDPSLACQAYIFALGVNDLYGAKLEIGTADDAFSDVDNNTFAYWYGQVIRRYRAIQPKSRLFLVSMPRNSEDPNADDNKLEAAHSKLLNEIAERLDFCYVIDLFKYAPAYKTEEFKRNFHMADHMNPAGYKLTAYFISSYIDYIIRHNMDDFKQVGFIGTEHQWRDI